MLAAAVSPAIDLPAATDESFAFVDEKIASSSAGIGKRIVVFSLISCEFCWTIFKLLDAIGEQGEAHEGALSKARCSVTSGETFEKKHRNRVLMRELQLQQKANALSLCMQNAYLQRAGFDPT